MDAVVGHFLLLLQVSHGVHSHCDGRQNGAQCFGAVGGSVDIQLMNNNAEIKIVQLVKEGSVINWKFNTIVANNTESRTLFFPSNGTFRLYNLIQSDSGQYNVQLFNKDGKLKGTHTLHLSVQDQRSLRVGTVSALAVFCVCLTVICALRKTNKRKDEGEDTELTYADVRLVHQPVRKPKKQKVEEVEYGEIKSTS